MTAVLEKFEKYLEQINILERAADTIFWDMRTVMPEEGFKGQAQAATYFSTEVFKLSTSDELMEMLNELSRPQEYGKLNDKWKFVVDKMKTEMELDRKVPSDFYEKYVTEQNESEQAWEMAKNASDYSIFEPHLEKMIELTKKMAAYRRPDMEVYDYLLDQYEKGMDSKTIDRIFVELKEELIPLVKKITNAEQPDESKFAGKYDIDAQRRVQDLLLEYIGFDFKRGTTGETEHPFTMNFTSKDVRVTNHYFEHEAINSMFSAIHEGGHAIFEQNVNPDYDGTVAGSCCYMGVHESQSRFYENILGRNKNFWVPIYDKIQDLLPVYKNISLDEFYKEINHVRNSFIRTDADEVTYCLHIIIRYEIEKAIFRDGVKAAELPKLWNEKMQEYLGITPENDSEGILQDMHWSDGSFGYFPTYLLGSIYDGMFLEEIEQEMGDIDKILSEGRIKEITKWLNDKIHKYGSTRTPAEVIENVCHKEISAEPLLKYFKDKYAAVYGIETMN